MSVIPEKVLLLVVGATYSSGSGSLTRILKFEVKIVFILSRQRRIGKWLRGFLGVAYQERK